MILSGEDMADITSQEGIVDLQKFIFDAQYVLYLQTVYFIELYTTVLPAVFLVLVFCRYQIYLAVGIFGQYY
jgi:hypothetical protein